jgi:hypothetical protein
MVNEEIVGGLKSALERGQTLQMAMMSLYNSGYKKEEIEEAARNLMQFSAESQLQPPVKTIPRKPEVKQAPQILTIPKTVKAFPELQAFSKPLPKQPLIYPKFEPQKPSLQFPKTLVPPVQQPQLVKSLPVQKVSGYGEPVLKQKEKAKEKGGSREKTIIFVLIFLLVFLFALLGAIFIFKQQLIDIFSSFFG